MGFVDYEGISPKDGKWCCADCRGTDISDCDKKDGRCKTPTGPDTCPAKDVKTGYEKYMEIAPDLKTGGAWSCADCNCKDVSSCTKEKGTSRCAAGAGTVTSAPSKVKLSVTFAALDFAKLNETHKVAIKGAVKASVLVSLVSIDSGYKLEHVEVSLKAGSVIADVTITPLAGTKASAVSASLDATKQTALNKQAALVVSLLPDMDKALAAGKTKADIATEVTGSAPTVAAGPGTISSAFAGRSLKVVSFVAALAYNIHM